MRVLIASNDGAEPRLEEMEEDTAVQMLLHGTARLDPDSATPPTAFVEAIVCELGDMERFGPSLAAPQDLAKAEAAVVGGLLQTIVGGHHLRWTSGGTDLRNLALERLWDGEADITSLRQELCAIRANNRRRIEYQASSRPAPVYSERHLEHMRQSNRLPNHEPPSPIIEMPPDWEAYGQALDRLDAEVWSRVESALESGHILCAERTDGRHRLLHPIETTRCRPRSQNKRFTYCFTADLAGAPHSEHSELNKQRLAARKWMLKVWEFFDSQGRIVAVQELKVVAKKKFGLATNAVNDAWDSAPNKPPPRRGAIPEAKRVSINEIKSLE